MKTLKRYCLALDLKNDPQLIEEYKNYHNQVWTEILESIRESGIESMEIYNVSNRLFMIMEVNETFDFEKKASKDASTPIVQKWEELMWKFQKPIPGGKPGEKWRLMDKIFELN
jgi:L-rhamnose mutarotase